ncbi:hypothetical protein [Leptospira fainei]|uniref:hypothetical protein n=1 Tax=Leptospira fainei TaxID=48782 RepID=UPI0012EBD799|nr:hypothetical protein [Leptospira fainei]
MKILSVLLGVWILWLYSPRGLLNLGQFNTIQECKTAINMETTGLIRWRTECLEAK